jgi:uncharacterized protein (DUF58 family)
MDQSAIPGARFVDPVVLARIGNLELVARAVVDGFINGIHRSPYFGASVDFAEHRGYVPGDDIRMLAGCLTYLVHRQRDRVGLVTFDSDVVEYVPPSAKHMDTVLHVLDRVKPSNPGSLKAPLHKVAEHFGRRGLLILVSDLYEEPDAVLDAIGPLRFRGHDIAVFHVLDEAELDFSFREPSAFEDLETGEQIPIVPDALAAQYKSLVQAHVDALRERFSANRIDYTLLNTSSPLDHALFSYLSTRERLSRVR